MANSIIQPWKELIVPKGTKAPGDFVGTMQTKRVLTTEWAEDILSKIPPKVYGKEMHFMLAMLTAGALGCEDGANRGEIYDRGQGAGLGLFPGDLAPLLRTSYLQQSWDHWVNIAMEPVIGSCRNLAIFSLEHRNEDFYLDCVSGHPRICWSKDDWWIFVIPEGMQPNLSA